MSFALKKITINSITKVDNLTIESSNEPFEDDKEIHLAPNLDASKLDITSIFNPIYDLISPKPVAREAKPKASKTLCTNYVHTNLQIKRNPGPKPFVCDGCCLQPHLQLIVELSDMNVNLFPAHYGYFDEFANRFVLFVEKGGKDNFIHLTAKLVNCTGELIKQNSLVNVDILDMQNNVVTDKTFYLGEPNSLIGKFPGYAGSYRHKLSSENFKASMQLNLSDGEIRCPIRFIKDKKIQYSPTYIIRVTSPNIQEHESYPLNILTKCKYAEIDETNVSQSVLGKRKLLDDE